MELIVRVGCRLVYETAEPTHALFLVQPQLDSGIQIIEEKLSVGIAESVSEYKDWQANLRVRLMLMPGLNEICHDALVGVDSLPESTEPVGPISTINEVPSELLPYTLPSRYCDSDKLMNFAWEKFGQTAHGVGRVQTICDWVHDNIEYRYDSGQGDLSASEVIERGFGVCRDLAHAAIGLCRAFNIPARYASGHLPDIGYESTSPMDFHAYMEVFLGQGWTVFDPRHNTPRTGRIKVAHGFDAIDGAFATVYGQANLTEFEVWAYQVDPREVSVGDPIDLSKRLDA